MAPEGSPRAGAREERESGKKVCEKKVVKWTPPTRRKSSKWNYVSLEN